MWAYDENNWHARSLNLPNTGDTEQCPGEEGGGGEDDEVSYILNKAKKSFSLHAQSAKSSETQIVH